MEEAGSSLSLSRDPLPGLLISALSHPSGLPSRGSVGPASSLHTPLGSLGPSLASGAPQRVGQAPRTVVQASSVLRASMGTGSVSDSACKLRTPHQVPIWANGAGGGAGLALWERLRNTY